MKRKSVRRSLLLFLCLCMLISGTAYAQDGNEDSQSAETTEGQEQEGEEKPEELAEEKPEESTVEGTKKARGVAAKEEGTEAAEGTQPKAVAASDVAIDEANFPDPVFRDYIIENFDLDGNGSLSEDEISAVEEIRIGVFDEEARSLSNLTGIQYFINLKALWCRDSQLKNLDVSKNIALKELHCDGSQLTSLDVSKNVALEFLDCSENQLTSLDVSSNVALKELYCVINQLTSLDVSKNVALEFLYCGTNQLTSLDVSKNVALTRLGCGFNQLMNLDVSGSPFLQQLDCGFMPKENIKYNSSRLSYFCHGGKPVYATAYFSQYEYSWIVDLSAIMEDYVFDVVWDGSFFDPTTGIWILGASAPDLEWGEFRFRRNIKGIEEFLLVPVHVDYGEPGETIKVEAEGTNVKADTSKVDTAAIYETFGIGPNDTNVEIKVEQKEAAVESKKRVEEILKQSGDTPLSVYEVVMSLYANGESKGTVTDRFGSLTLSFYAGKEHAGKKAVVCQLHGSDEVLTYKDLTIDDEGMVTISVSKLSSFAVALQNNAGAGTDQPGAGDSGTGDGLVINTGQPDVDRTSAASAQGASPRTGDSAHMALWIVAMLFSGSITAFAISRKRQR